MFVKVAELVKNNERMSIAGAIWSRPWLHTLDYSLRVGGNAGHILRRKSVPIIGVRENRELRSNTSSARILGPDESTDQIVECGSHVVHAIANQSADVHGRDRVAYPVDDPGRSLRAIDFNDSIVYGLFKKFENFPAKNV